MLVCLIDCLCVGLSVHGLVGVFVCRCVVACLCV